MASIVDLKIARDEAQREYDQVLHAIEHHEGGSEFVKFEGVYRFVSDIREDKARLTLGLAESRLKEALSSL